GTSGDQMWMDYGAPRKEIGYDAYAREIAELAAKAYAQIKFHDWVPIRMAESKLKLNYRTPEPARLRWAREIATSLNGRLPQTLPEIYATEAIYLHERQSTELILQAVRLGDLGITAIPNEVFALTGLKLKAWSPLKPTINVELANGAEGYIPPIEQHRLGGYTTWPARTAGLEVQAEELIVPELLNLLEQVSTKKRNPPTLPPPPSSNPLVYRSLDDMIISDAFEPGVALYLPGINQNSHAVHFAGGRLRENLVPDAKVYSTEFWFWNGLPNDARPVTGYLFSRGRDWDAEANGDHLGIGGTHEPTAQGKLILFNGNRANKLLIGHTVIAPRTWHHVALVRNLDRAEVYLDGKSEFGATIQPTSNSDLVFFGGRNDNFANFEGKLDEITIYDRALTPAEIKARFEAGGVEVAEAAKRKRASDPLSPQESLKKIHTSPGYKVELAASEPLVLDPVAIDWDTAGRLWAVEMADYPLGMDGKGKPGGRVRVLEDTNNDGVYDKSHLFADNLSFPTGLITWRDGVIVTAAPEIIFLRDTDNDGRADTRQVLFSGFLEGNQQLRINGLRWGLDNWIYCAVGGHYRGYGAAVKIKSHLTGEEIPLGSRDFRFRPDTGEFDPQSGPAQFGRNRDDWGRWFGTQNSNPLWHYVLQDHYIRRNPHVAAPDPTVQVMRPLNPKVFPVSSPEKRYHSYEQAGHFTSGCSGTIYRDNLLFPATEMHAFACEPFHNLVHHEILSDDGVSFSAQRTPAEQTSEIFASEDSWTRPVMIRTGPDGALWVVDMYRYMIEHPDWLPAEGKEELLPHYREGDDKGRIYRLVPTQSERRTRKRLDNLSTPDLVAALDSSNEWQRDKAQQLLLWRNDKSKHAIGALGNLAVNSNNPLARLHALCTLDGLLNSGNPNLLEPALRDQNPGFRENALRLAEKHFTPAALIPPALTLAALTLIDDPSPKVRLQLACTLGEWKTPEAGRALASLANKNHRDPFIASAIMSSAIPHLETLISQLNVEALSTFSEPLFTTALGMNRRDLVHRLLKPLFDSNQFARYSAFLDLLKRRNTSVAALIKADEYDDLGKLLAQQSAFVLRAMQTVADSSAGSDRRFDGLELMTHDPGYQQTATRTLRLYLNTTNPIELQRKAINVIANTASPAVPSLLVSNWTSHTPETKSACLEALLRREPWTFELAQQIESGAVPPTDLDAARRNRLLKHNSKRISELAQKIFSNATTSARAKIIEDFRHALKLTGNPAAGKETYAKLCITCHRRDNLGNEVGPNLQSVVEHPPEKLLVNILDPNVDIQPGYNAYTCALKNGEELQGLITAETANSVIFKSADGASRTINRAEINSLRSSNTSLMPEGLEAGLTHQSLADLIAYIKSR
ncbi:MAG TPA: PVC-type heme-binding CxxCH protein, partial [Verrucomicrobiae bacterium]|nr:PVC-type heme-binding CxxCH protein [Verrucomicrobiae bacterium]